MTESDFEPGPTPPPVAPPTVATTFVYDQPRTSNWPTVIGVIAIVFGVLGILGGIWGALSAFFLRMMMSNVPQNAAATASWGVLHEWRAWTVSLAIVMAGLAVLLLIAGIGLMRRRGWARETALAWAGLKLAFVLVNVSVGCLIQRESLEAANASTLSTTSGFMTSMAALTLVLGILWGWALPVFLLIWLFRGTIKAETAAWPETGASSAPE